ncbi:MAG: hypothetical protein IKS51_06250 [Erysipelotrichaceae bacterium]|nr:hypothetical protein [Erysipelotrichaceae bacterium]
MKRRCILISIAVLLLSALFPFTVKAETVSFDVTFESSGGDYTITGNDDDSSVYDVLKGMQPGDTADIEFVLKNDTGKKIAWWMKNNALTSFEDEGVAKHGAYTYDLSLVNSSGTESVLYSNNEVGGQDSTEGLHEATETLKDDFIFLEEIEGNQTIRVKLHLELEGETQSNLYQEVLGQLEFIFATELIESGKRIIYVVPHTGIEGRDSVNTRNRLILLVSLVFMALAGLYLLLSRKSLKKARNTAVAILLALTLIIPLFTERVNAYSSYKVTLLAGNYGKIIDPADGQKKDRVELEFFPDSNDPNERIWTPGDYDVVVTDDRYYCNNEYHISGIEGIAEAQEIKEDMVFVATYRIKGDLVAYTIHYVDASGAQLLPDSVFHGNIGEEAVLAYKYVEGYLPNEFTQSHILSDDEDENVFTFTYHRAETGEGGETVIVYEEGEPVVRPSTPGGNQSGTTPAVPSEPAEPTEPVEPSEPTEPTEPVDIDDPTTPTTVDPEPTVKPEPDKEDQPFIPMAILIGGGSLLFLFLLLFLLRRRRKDQEE